MKLLRYSLRTTFSEGTEGTHISRSFSNTKKISIDSRIEEMKMEARGAPITVRKEFRGKRGKTIVREEIVR